MVLITKEKKTYNYPINLQPTDPSEYTLEVYSHMSKTTTTFTGLTGVVVDDFVGIEMTDVMLSKLPNGEYDYTVYDNDQTRVSIGLLRVDLEQQGEEDEPEYVVYHDEMEGYITTQNQEEAYEQGYTDGYQSGFTDGVDSVPLVATGFTSNGTFSATTGGFNVVTVNVPTGITPSGTIEITENGIYDVTEKASANVQIPVEDYWQSGYTSGYESGFTNGEIVGYESGYTDGYQSGYTSGETIGYQSGYTDGYQSGVTDGTQSGYTSGYTDGFQSGFTSGETYGFQVGYDSGFTDGVDSGFTSGYTTGYQSGYTNGYYSGFTDGFSSGYTSGETDGFQSGYSSGFTDGVDSVPLNSTGFTENGSYTASTGGWSAVTVNVPTGITPTGQIAISGNGTYDVTQYASANVNIPLSTTGFTSNGTYTKENGGWNVVTVNVPSVTTQTMTQAQYDALTIKDPMVIYLING